MSKSSAMDLVAQFMGRQNTIPIPVPFVRLLGDYAAAAFLAQCLYWTDRSSEKGGWFYKSREEWGEELCLTEKQVRRCMEVCAEFVEVERRGIPARNFYRPQQGKIAAALTEMAGPTRAAQKGQLDKPKRASKSSPKGPNSEAPKGQQVGQKKGQLITETTTEPTHNPQQIKNTLTADAVAGALDLSDSDFDELLGLPDGSGANAPTQELTSLTEIKPSTPEGETSKATGKQNVPPAAARHATAPSTAEQLIAAWNEHRGTLPRVEDINEGRVKSAKKLLKDCGGDLEKAITLVADATRDVATDPFWCERRYGFDNLVPGKVFARAEAWRSRQFTPPASSLAQYDQSAPAYSLRSYDE